MLRKMLAALAFALAPLAAAAPAHADQRPVYTGFLSNVGVSG
jgi:ABC-type sugar transport system substrate-binding protein